MADDWRTTQYLKKMRQSVTCPLCGATVSTEEGYRIHEQWHGNLNTWVQQIADNFQIIFDYITNPASGLEKRLADTISAVSHAVDTLRSDATTAIDSANQSVISLRDEANSAINTLRADATNAINAQGTRITTLETEVTKNPGGIWSRLAALEIGELNEEF